MQVRPQHAAGDVPSRVEHMMMIVPINAEVDEAEHVAQERRHDFDQRVKLCTVWRPELEHHDRDQNGDHGVADRLETLFAHPINVGARATTYSALITSAGLTCIARLAGTSIATTAGTTNAKGAATNVGRSCASTWNNSAAIRRESAHAPASPIVSPMTRTLIISRPTSATMLRPVAPSAARMPNSRARRVTL